MWFEKGSCDGIMKQHVSCLLSDTEMSGNQSRLKTGNLKVKLMVVIRKLDCFWQLVSN